MTLDCLFCRAMGAGDEYVQQTDAESGDRQGALGGGESTGGGGMSMPSLPPMGTVIQIATLLCGLITYSCYVSQTSTGASEMALWMILFCETSALMQVLKGSGKAVAGTEPLVGPFLLFSAVGSLHAFIIMCNQCRVLDQPYHAPQHSTLSAATAFAFFTWLLTCAAVCMGDEE